MNSDIWCFGPHLTMKNLRSLLLRIGVPNGERLGWKGFRAGKATQMAAQGDRLGETLTAGEWRSRAFLNYVDESAVDQARLLADTVEASSDEEASVLHGL